MISAIPSPLSHCGQHHMITYLLEGWPVPCVVPGGELLTLEEVFTRLEVFFEEFFHFFGVCYTLSHFLLNKS